MCRLPLRTAGNEAGDDAFMLSYRLGLAVVAGEAGRLLLGWVFVSVPHDVRMWCGG